MSGDGGRAEDGSAAAGAGRPTLGSATAPLLRREGLSAAAAMLVAVPAAIANGLVMYAPLGPAFTGAGALAGVVGAGVLGTIAALLGGTPALVSAPSPAAAAFMAVVATQLLAHGERASAVPAQLAVVIATAGILQVGAGLLRWGRLVKFLPYPVIAGYLTGGGLLILHLQLGKVLGAPSGWSLGRALLHPRSWTPAAIVIAAATLTVTLAAPRLTRKLPPTLLGLGAGVLVHRLLALRWPELRAAGDGGLVVGRVLADPGGAAWLVSGLATALSAPALRDALVAGATLAVLLSVDTLKTCVLVDAATLTRHDSDRELVGQGIGNALSALAGGAPGTGIVSGSLVNVSSGARTRWSGALAGVLALGVLGGLSELIASLPVPALAAIVVLMAWRMIQPELVELLRDRATLTDFAVAATVIGVAVAVNLAAAAGAGVLLSVMIFLRDQARTPVVRRALDGGSVLAHRRGARDARLLERHASETLLVELQGSLFFGTADRLAAELEPRLARSRFVVLDLSRVGSIDLTAVRALKPIAARLARDGGQLVLCGIAEGAQRARLASYLGRLGLATGPAAVAVATDVDAALELAEERILGGERPWHTPLPFEQMELVASLPADAVAALRTVAREVRAPRGTRIITAGERGRELFLVRRGQIRIEAPMEGGAPKFLTVLGPGDLLGELAYLDGAVRSADAIVARDAELYQLTPEDVARAAAGCPGLEAALAARIAVSIAERLRRATTEARRLRES